MPVSWLGPTATRSTPSCSSIAHRSAMTPSTTPGRDVRRVGRRRARTRRSGCGRCPSAVGRRPAEPRRSEQQPQAASALRREVHPVGREVGEPGVGGDARAPSGCAGVVGVEADHGHGAERGGVASGRRPRRSRAAARCRSLAVGVVRRHGRQPVLDRRLRGRRPGCVSSASSSSRQNRGCTKSRSGRPALTHQPDRVVVLHGAAPARRRKLRSSTSTGARRVGDVVRRDPGRAALPVSSSGPSVPIDHDAVAGQQQLGATSAAGQVDVGAARPGRGR